MLRVFTFKYIIIWGDTEDAKEIYMGRPIPRLSENDIPNEDFIFKNFESAFEFFSKHHFSGISTSTFFGKSYISSYDNDFPSITKKNFKPFMVMKCYLDITDRVSIQELAKDLSADDFCRFLKDREVFFSKNLLTN